MSFSTIMLSTLEIQLLSNNTMYHSCTNTRRWINTINKTLRAEQTSSRAAVHDIQLGRTGPGRFHLVFQVLSSVPLKSTAITPIQQRWMSFCVCGAHSTTWPLIYFVCRGICFSSRMFKHVSEWTELITLQTQNSPFKEVWILFTCISAQAGLKLWKPDVTEPESKSAKS